MKNKRAQLKTKKIKDFLAFNCPKKMNSRGQLKIQQMAFMLLAVTLFFVLVGLFVFSIKTAGLRKSATELEERNALLLITRLANSPEFSCGEAFAYGKTSCIDADKIMILKNKKSYGGFWQVANIQIRKIYPKTENEVECNFGNYPRCNLINVYSRNVKSGPYVSNFVSLCRKETFEQESYDKCDIAKLMVSYEVKE